jgi:hypothetical protein
VLTIAASARILRADYGAMRLDGACEAHAEIDAWPSELQLP